MSHNSFLIIAGGNLSMAFLVTASTFLQMGVVLVQVRKGGAVLLPKWMQPNR
jgi:hypothetical protein